MSNLLYIFDIQTLALSNGCFFNRIFSIVQIYLQSRRELIIIVMLKNVRNKTSNQKIKKQEIKRNKTIATKHAIIYNICKQ